MKDTKPWWDYYDPVHGHLDLRRLIGILVGVLTLVLVKVVWS